MGSGKTTKLIELINAAPEQRYLIVVKRISEIERIMKECTSAGIMTPDSHAFGAKEAHFRILLKAGENICITHELFSRLSFSKQEQETIHEQQYILILDEVPEVIVPIKVSDDDKKVILDKYAAIDESGHIHWEYKEYKGAHAELKRQIQTKSVIYWNESTFLWLLPIELVKSFRSVIIMSFMFEYSHMWHYLGIYGMDYTAYHIRQGRLIEGKEALDEILPELRRLITVYQGPLNEIGDERTALSYTWQSLSMNRKLIKRLENYIYNFFRWSCRTSKADWLWTRYKTRETESPKLRGEVARQAFCACNATAINEYRHKQSVAYCVNVFENPITYNWFKKQGVTLDQEALALSQMLQWVWRSAIREKKAIKIYIPSRRMRELFEYFLETGRVKHGSWSDEELELDSAS